MQLKMLPLLKERKVLVLFFSNLFSNIGINITAIGIPWYFVQNNGDQGQLLGLSMIFGTVATFLINPLLGGLIDTKSRKELILIENGIGVIVLTISSLYGFLTNSFNTSVLVAIFIFGMILRGFHYSNLTALNQELFRKEQYTGISTITEIEGQISVIASGVIGAYLVTHYDLIVILSIDAFSYLVAFALLLFLPYRQTYKNDYQSPSYFRDIKAGVSYFKSFPKQILLLFSLSLPFIVRGLTSLILPYYVAIQLNSSGDIYGLAQTIYGIGAVTGGLCIGYLLKKYSNLNVLLFSFILFSLSLLVLAVSSIEVIAITIQLFMGMSVSSIRISKNAIMMESISKEIIGRITALLNSVTTVIQLVFVGFFTWILVIIGPAISYGLLIILLLMGGVGTYLSLRRGGINYDKGSI